MAFKTNIALIDDDFVIIKDFSLNIFSTHDIMLILCVLCTIFNNDVILDLKMRVFNTQFYDFIKFGFLYI